MAEFHNMQGGATGDGSFEEHLRLRLDEEAYSGAASRSLVWAVEAAMP